MRSPVLFSALFSTAIVLAILHISALNFYLYWIFPWLDLVAHMLGGIALGFLYLLTPLFIKGMPDRYITLAGLLSFVFIVGLVWEIFEIQIGLPNFYEYDFYIRDLYLDLLFDGVGGLIAFFVGSRLKDL